MQGGNVTYTVYGSVLAVSGRPSDGLKLPELFLGSKMRMTVRFLITKVVCMCAPGSFQWENAIAIFVLLQVLARMS